MGCFMESILSHTSIAIVGVAVGYLLWCIAARK